MSVGSLDLVDSSEHTTPRYASLRLKLALRLGALFLALLGLILVDTRNDLSTVAAVRLQAYTSAVHWLQSDQSLHAARAMQQALRVQRRLADGTLARFCGHAPSVRFAVVAPDHALLCNTLPWMTASSLDALDGLSTSAPQPNVVRTGARGEPAQYRGVLAYPVRSATGAPMATILVSLDLSSVPDELQRARLPPDSRFVLFNRAGTILAASPTLAPWIGLPLKAIPPRGPGATQDRDLRVTYPARLSDADIGVQLDVPVRAIRQPVQHQLASDLGRSALLFALASLAYTWGDRSLLKRLSLITSGYHALTKTDPDFRPAPRRGGDEVDRLAAVVDEGASILQAKERRLGEVSGELRRVHRALRVLSIGNTALLSDSTEPELLDRLCREIVEQGLFHLACIAFIGTEQDHFLRLAACHVSDGDPRATVGPGFLTGQSATHLITRLRRNHLLVINDTLHTDVEPEIAGQALAFGCQSFIALPLQGENQLIGVMMLGASAKQEFCDLQVSYLQETAGDVSSGMQMRRTRGELHRLSVLEEHHDQLMRNLLEDALLAIAKTTEMRDPYTAGHQHRVAGLAEALAEELGLEAEEVHGIYLAAIVHDIGKVSIPAEILVKPSKLTDIEYALVKNHAVVGYDILSQIRFPWPIAQIVRQHHERLDGSGYPEGLKGGQILFGARILSVADVVEAVTFHRPYRPMIGLEAAMTIIEEGRGTLFDAAVVDACQRLFQNGRFEWSHTPRERSPAPERRVG